MSNTICHLEIPTTNLKKAGEFYRELFGWELDYNWGSDMAMFKTEEGRLSGGGFDRKDKPSPGIVIYIQVNDIDTILGKAVKLGGKKIQGKTDTPRDIGWFALFKDLDDNTIGLFTPKNNNG